MAHANGALTPRARQRLAQLVVDHAWPVARAAERFQVSWPTAKCWATRYAQTGAEGMADRSSRPHHSPHRTPAPLVRIMVHLRWKHKLGPVHLMAKYTEGKAADVRGIARFLAEASPGPRTTARNVVRADAKFHRIDVAATPPCTARTCR